MRIEEQPAQLLSEGPDEPETPVRSEPKRKAAKSSSLGTAKGAALEETSEKEHATMDASADYSGRANSSAQLQTRAANAASSPSACREVESAALHEAPAQSFKTVGAAKGEHRKAGSSHEGETVPKPFSFDRGRPKGKGKGSTPASKGLQSQHSVLLYTAIASIF